MVDAEDKEFEDDIINSGYHIAVPVQIEKKESGDLRIIAYSFVMDKAREFEEKHGASPFTPDAFAFLDQNIAPVMQGLDFSAEHATERIFREYRCDKINRDALLGECEIIDSLDGEEWDEELELDAFSLEESNMIDRMAVVRDGGKIICYAGLDDVCENDGLLEVTVECAAGYRRRGYGSACVARLTEYLLSLGERVKYVCEDDNPNSMKTAARAGYTLYKTVLPYVCYKHGRDGSEEDDEYTEHCRHEHED